MPANDSTKSFSSLLNRIYDDWKEVYLTERPDPISWPGRFFFATAGALSFLLGSLVYIGFGVGQSASATPDGAGMQALAAFLYVPGLWVYLGFVMLYGLFLGYLVGHAATKRGAISIFVAGTSCRP